RQPRRRMRSGERRLERQHAVGVDVCVLAAERDVVAFVSQRARVGAETVQRAAPALPPTDADRDDTAWRPGWQADRATACVIETPQADTRRRRTPVAHVRLVPAVDAGAERLR